MSNGESNCQYPIQSILPVKRDVPQHKHGHCNSWYWGTKSNAPDADEPAQLVSTDNRDTAVKARNTELGNDHNTMFVSSIRWS